MIDRAITHKTMLNRRFIALSPFGGIGQCMPARVVNQCETVMNDERKLNEKCAG